MSIHADENGNIAFNLPIGQGQLKIPGNFTHNGNLDIDGVKLPPGSSVTSLNMDAHEHGATVNISFTAPGSPDDVRSYFIGEFKKQGGEAVIAGASVRGASKDGSPFTIQVSPAGNGARGKIVAQSKS